MRLLVQLGLLSLVSFAVCACSGESVPSAADTPETSAAELAPAPAVQDIGEPLYQRAAAWPQEDRRSGIARDPIVLPDCRLALIDRQDVPSQREGVIRFIGTEIQPGEEVPGERLVSVPSAAGVKRYRRLQEGDRVLAGQLLAQLDDRLAEAEFLIRSARLAASKADLAASEKTRDEAKSRYETQLGLARKQAASREELRGAGLTWERYFFEAIAKREASKLAEHERNQAQTVLEMHQLRSALPGIIKTIYKKPGEAVRQLEPVFQIHELSRLRIEGLIESEYVSRLRQGMRVILEPSRSEGPEQTLLGHLQEITAVAVSADLKKPLLVSASEDGSVRVWERSSRHEQRVLWHPAPVRAVACNPAAAPAPRWCLTGAADGLARLYDLDSSSLQPLRVFPNSHQGSLTCVAFTPDGKSCATGGEDQEIALWDPATGELRYRFPAGHRAALTSLQFTPQSQLVSAGRDNTLRVWTLGVNGARLETTIDRRSGEVAWPGVSPDGRHVLLDQGPSLRLLTLKDRLTAAVLQQPVEATQFSTFALFSPDGRMILTAGAAEGRVQLWRAATPTTRPYELRHFVNRERSPATCAAFAADGSFVVTGNKDRQVLVWPLPPAREVEEQLTAELTLIERVVESSSRQVRIWAEVARADERLLPGTTVTLTIYADKETAGDGR